MKKIYKMLAVAVVAVVATTACQDGYIDDITAVQPGADEAPPQVTIGYPTNATLLIPFTDESTQVNFEFEVTDDIEIASVTLALNGTTLETLTDFKDYRRIAASHLSETLPVGDYTVDVTATDVSGKSTTKSFAFEISNIYQAKYDGEIFYMPFEGDIYLDLLENITATKVGNPGFAAGKSGRAYANTTGSYISLPAADVINNEFSASFWYKVNATPDRAGILTISPPGPTNNNRTSGFRLFRENAGGKQRIKLNVGNGTADNWFDGGAAADIDATSDWVHVAFTIAGDQCAVYINGNVVSQGTYPGISWADCDGLTIGSGAPNFTEWNHLSDLSLIDELRIFDKSLTQEEVKTIFEDN
ncbi:LamG domain-containing protein [Parapedobacter soli]|uniref:LamG domain-containing protein n=1 Tax=Parapedobacter soli TaxID=416955 RepID=UPI0021CA4E60|nr:LamG domain-containing protein [Parapedobacter soli]